MIDIDHNDPSFKALSEQNLGLPFKTAERVKFEESRDRLIDELDKSGIFGPRKNHTDSGDEHPSEYEHGETGKSHNLTVMHSSDRMDWGTDPKTFEWLDNIYRFNLDAAANLQNHKCWTWFGPGSVIAEDALSISWDLGENTRVFLNPPYGRGMIAWIDKCIGESAIGSTIVALVPSRTGSGWFREALKHAMVRMDLYGREKFVNPDAPDEKSPAPFDSTILVFAPAPHYAMAHELDAYPKGHVERLYVTRHLKTFGSSQDND